MRSRWDVIVIGAGPGGSSSAYGLARAGLRVLLLEKERIPRYKPCGGGLTCKVRDALDFDFSPVVEDSVRQVSLAHRQDRFRIEYNQAWCVMRPRFDALLADRAANAGAELRDAQAVSAISFEEDAVTVSTPQGAERAPLLVGADGVNGIVRRAAGFPPHRRMAVALEAEMDVPRAAIDGWHNVLHLDFGAIPWGYAWIFPKAEHLSIGIGVLRIDHPVDLRSALARYVDDEPTLAGARARLVRGHRVPLGGLPSRYDAPRVLLVGDAAGLADPFTAEGIYYAIRSGQMAAEEVRRALQRTGDSKAFAKGLAAYSRRVNAEINSDFRYAWALAHIFYRMPHFSLDILKHSRSTWKAAVNVVNGGLSYRELLGRAAASVVGLASRKR